MSRRGGSRRLAHRVAELENLPYGLSSKPHILKVRSPCPVQGAERCHLGLHDFIP